MIWFFFCAFVVLIGAVVLVSGISAHFTLRTAAGWWAGVLISITLFLLAQPLFQSLPEKVVTVVQQSGCDTYHVNVTETNWDVVANELIQVNLFFVLLGFLFCLAGLKVLEKCDIPEKLMAFIFLALAFTSLSSLLYVFLIRKLGYLIFSTVIGILTGIPVYLAFLTESTKKK